MFPQAECAIVYAAHPAYGASLANLAGQTLLGDGMFSDNSAEQIAAQTLVVTGDPRTGFRATATLGLAS